MTAALAGAGLLGQNARMHTTRRDLLLALGAGLATAGLTGCAPHATREGSPLVLRYASPYAPGHPYSRADLAWMAERAGRAAEGCGWKDRARQALELALLHWSALQRVEDCERVQVILDRP